MDKTEVTLFFVQMKNLESFSCFDEERVLFRLEVRKTSKISFLRNHLTPAVTMVREKRTIYVL